MALVPTTPSSERTDRSELPPFAPDPDIIGNNEGNERILKSDRDAARELLEKQDQQR
jgi:hypothetical protein